MTYDLRRLRMHELIERIPHSHRYRVSDAGLPIAMFLTRVHDQFLPTGLAHHLDPTDTGTQHTAAIRYQRALDEIAQHSGLAA